MTTETTKETPQPSNDVDDDKPLVEVAKKAEHIEETKPVAEDIVEKVKDKDNEDFNDAEMKVDKEDKEKVDKEDNVKSESKPEKEQSVTPAGHNSPAHDDSDYEDNIVVKVPSASDTRTEKFLGRRHTSHPKPPGLESSSPKSRPQVISKSPFFIFFLNKTSNI